MQSQVSLWEKDTQGLHTATFTGEGKGTAEQRQIRRFWSWRCRHVPKNASSHPRLEEVRKRFPARASGESMALWITWVQPSNTHCGILASRPVRQQVCFILNPKFVTVYSSSHQYLIHHDRRELVALVKKGSFGHRGYSTRWGVKRLTLWWISEGSSDSKKLAYTKFCFCCNLCVQWKKK